jgi:hypothetical protein
MGVWEFGCKDGKNLEDMILNCSGTEVGLINFHNEMMIFIVKRS